MQTMKLIAVWQCRFKTYRPQLCRPGWITTELPDVYQMRPFNYVYRTNGHRKLHVRVNRTEIPCPHYSWSSRCERARGSPEPCGNISLQYPSLRCSPGTVPTTCEELCKIKKIFYCIVFTHFYSASLSKSLSEALPTTASILCLELTHQSATGSCEWKTCPRSLCGS